MFNYNRLIYCDNKNYLLIQCLKREIALLNRDIRLEKHNQASPDACNILMNAQNNEGMRPTEVVGCRNHVLTSE